MMMDQVLLMTIGVLGVSISIVVKLIFLCRHAGIE
jgi:hypothetical protein